MDDIKFFKDKWMTIFGYYSRMNIDIPLDTDSVEEIEKFINLNWNTFRAVQRIIKEVE